MVAVRTRVDGKTLHSSQRSTTRRKLRLKAPGWTASEGDALILDISTTGLLIKTSGDLGVGETVELDLPDAPGVRLIVKWSSGQLFGCEFTEPVSAATVSAALLRAPAGTRRSQTLAPQPAGIADDGRDTDEDEKLPLTVRMRWIAGLTLVCWGLVAAPLLLAWRYI